MQYNLNSQGAYNFFEENSDPKTQSKNLQPINAHVIPSGMFDWCKVS